MKLKLIIGLFALMGFNQAWAVPCSDTTSGVFVSGTVANDLGSAANSVSTACTDGGAGNDGWPDDLVIFGNTYEALQKQNTPGALETEIDIDLVVSPLGGTLSGTWSFTNIAAYDTYIIRLKDGGTPQWSTYLLDWTLFGDTGSTWSGDWVYGQGKELSHLSVYGWNDPDRDEDNGVPAPAILGIMGIGLVGMIFSSGLRRRKIS